MTIPAASTISTSSNHNTNHNDIRIPLTTQPLSEPPQSTISKKRHPPITFTFRKLLVYIRVLILLLALVSLILDAITISFQTNVMNLEYEDVSRQAYLLLTPDLLAIFMIAFLLIYPSSLCCGSTHSNSQETPYVEEFYDYDAEEEYDDEESNRSQLGGREETSSVTATALTDSATRQATLGSRITPSTAAANSTKATLRSQAQAASPFSPAHDNNKQENEDNSLQRLYHNSHQNTGLNYSHARQQQPSFATIPASTTTPHSHQNNSSTNFNSTVDQRSQHLLHSQGHDRITTHTVDTSATAVSPTDFSPSKDNFVTEKTIHGQSIITADVLSSPEVSPAEMIAQEEKEETVRKRRRARQYTLIRIIFSLGLTILALYWPAGQFKAPIGKLNNASTARDNQPIHGNDTLISNSLPSPTTTSTTPTPTGFIFTASVPEYSHNIAADPNRTMLSVGQRSYYNRHNRKGRQQEPPWCIEEKEFGDDESAVVYCRVKVIRPIVTYVWAVFLVVELCIAAMAGDFSKHGIRRKYPLSFGEGDAHSGYRQDYVLDQQENAEKQVQSSQHGQSVRSLAISESAGVADTNTIVQQQHRQQSSQRSRTENQLVH